MIVVADIGSCHMAKWDYIKEAIRIVKDCGIDIIKFQLFKVSMWQGNSWEREKRDTNGNIEFPRELWNSTVDYARKIDVDIFASVFDVEAVDMLVANGIDKVKLAYSETWNLKLLKYIRNYKDQGKIKEIWASGDENNYPHYADIKLYRPEGYPPKKNISDIPYGFDGLSSHYIPPYKHPYVDYLEIHMTLNHCDIDCPDGLFAYSPTNLKKIKDDLCVKI